MHVRMAAAVVLLTLSAAAPAATGRTSDEAHLEASVNTFIGTRDDGNTFPGASAPFGLIQVSPIGAHYAGWRYDDPAIRGFGHSFISGAGCWEQGGTLSVLPVTGRIGKGGGFDTGDAATFDQKKYASAFDHAG